MPDAQVQPVLARAGKCRGHFRRGTDQCHDDETHESRRHAERLRCLLHRLDENLANQRHQHRDARQCGQGQTDRPRRLARLAADSALANSSRVRLERKQHAQPVGNDEQHRQTRRLSFWVNAAPRRASLLPRSPKESSSAIVARKSRPACTRALTRLYSCTWCLSPPSRNDAPNMNKVLVTIAPAMDAFTSMYCPARNAASAMTSSVRFPSVALSRPPTASPVLAATDSVA